MPATIVIGAQWGDEGKGRVADWLAAEADVVARYAGGDNAGHTVVVGEKIFKLRINGPGKVVSPHQQEHADDQQNGSNDFVHGI